MVKDWPELAAGLSQAMTEVRKGIPEVMTAFSALAKAANKAGAVDPKTKELVSMAISITTRCDGCVTFHSRAAWELGATRDEILEIIGISVYMGGGPSVIYGALALEAYDQYAQQDEG